MDDTGIPPKPYSKGNFNAFRQQNIKSVFVVYSPLPVICVLLFTAALCLLIGIVEIVYARRARLYDFRYDNISHYTFTMENTSSLPHTFSFDGKTYSMGKQTFLLIELTETVAAPVLLRYRLKGFYQSFRNFYVSKDEYQLFGEDKILNSDCKPFRYPGEVVGDIQPGYYAPCGSMAWSLFNDSFKLYKVAKGSFTGSEVPSDATIICDGSAFGSEGISLTADNQCSKDNIALPSLVSRYKAPSSTSLNSGPIWSAGGNSSSSDPYNKEGYYYGEPGHLIPDSQDQDFILWSSPSYLPDFTNTYRIINEDLEPGEYLFDITELYSFPGEKHIIIETDNAMGSSFVDTGAVTVAIGAFSLLGAIFAAILRYPFASV